MVLLTGMVMVFTWVIEVAHLKYTKPGSGRRHALDVHFCLADGVDVWRLISDEDAPIPDVSVVLVKPVDLPASRNPILDIPLKGQKGGGPADPRGLGPKTKEALELHGGVVTIADLAALTTAQQEALLASVPRSIASQLARKGGLAAIVQRAKELEAEGRAEKDRAEKDRAEDRTRLLDDVERSRRSYEKRFKEYVACEREEYARLLGVEEQLAAMWRNDRVALRPEVLLGRLRRQREDAELAKVKNVEFTYLNASLSDGAIGPDGLQLRVLRSSRRVWQVGKKLRNCATAYSSRCAEGKYVLVALVHAANATPVALGGYVVGRSGQWEQVLRDPPPVTHTPCDYRLAACRTPRAAQARALRQRSDTRRPPHTGRGNGQPAP